jgi:hypothetical protein
MITLATSNGRLMLSKLPLLQRSILGVAEKIKTGT